MRISLPRVKYDTPARVDAFYDRLLERVRALPGVESVGAAQGTPFSGWDVHYTLTVEGQPPAGPGEELDVHAQYVTPDYLPTIGVPILRGRGLAPTDRDTLVAPSRGGDFTYTWPVEGQPPAGPGEELDVHAQYVTPDYLPTIGVPILRGRGLAPTDRDTLAPVGIVNETFAKRIFPGAEPIGKRVKLGSHESSAPYVTIVGVMRDY